MFSVCPLAHPLWLGQIAVEMATAAALTPTQTPHPTRTWATGQSIQHLYINTIPTYIQPLHTIHQYHTYVNATFKQYLHKHNLYTIFTIHHYRLTSLHKHNHYTMFTSILYHFFPLTRSLHNIDIKTKSFIYINATYTVYKHQYCISQTQSSSTWHQPFTLRKPCVCFEWKSIAWMLWHHLPDLYTISNLSMDTFTSLLLPQ